MHRIIAAFLAATSCVAVAQAQDNRTPPIAAAREIRIGSGGSRR
jgi:hypothetical protein